MEEQDHCNVCKKAFEGLRPYYFDSEAGRFRLLGLRVSRALRRTRICDPQCSKCQVTESRDAVTRDSDGVWTRHDKLEQSDN